MDDKKATLVIKLMAERRDIGQLIDFRSANNVPFSYYVCQYDELTRQIERLIEGSLL